VSVLTQSSRRELILSPACGACGDGKTGSRTRRSNSRFHVIILFSDGKFCRRLSA
jgi:hypothetical protein